MHTTDALKLGESPRRLQVLAAWHESRLFTPKERAALLMTDTATRITERGVPENVYAEVREHFSEREYMDLIMVINVINAWNRISVSTGLQEPV
jgi:alkylhydroperoxidase family enzyme